MATKNRNELGLTHAQMRVMRLWTYGAAREEIGALLNLSVYTVATHIRDALSDAGLNGLGEGKIRVMAAMIALYDAGYEQPQQRVIAYLAQARRDSEQPCFSPLPNPTDKQSVLTPTG